MSFTLRATIDNFLKLRDELTLRNIRWQKLWPMVLVLPLTVIVSALRHFDLEIQALGMESYELVLFPYGLGCLLVALLPKKTIYITLRMAAVCSLALVPFQILLTGDIARLVTFMAFYFFIGVCTGTAHYIFVFTLNNIERLFGLSIILFYYGLLYTIFRSFPAIQLAVETWVSLFVVAVYVAVVFFATKKENNPPQHETSTDEKTLDTASSGTARSGAAFVIGLSVVYYMLISTINYIE